jgi:hypothetical protein
VLGREPRVAREFAGIGCHCGRGRGGGGSGENDCRRLGCNPGEPGERAPAARMLVRASVLMWLIPLSWRRQHVLQRLLRMLSLILHRCPAVCISKEPTLPLGSNLALACSPCVAPQERDHAFGEVGRGRGQSVRGLALLANRWGLRLTDDERSKSTRSEEKPDGGGSRRRSAQYGHSIPFWHATGSLLRTCSQSSAIVAKRC